MSLFETYATLSASFALAVPVIFLKFMKPGYAKRVNSFRISIIGEYYESLKEALEIFEPSKELTEEAIERMDDVTDDWVEVRSKYTKLDDLSNKYMKLLFVGWMVSIVASLFAQQQQEFKVMPLGMNWFVIAPIVLYLMFIFAGWYVLKIIEFDRELSKFSKSDEIEEFRLGDMPRRLKAAEIQIEDILNENNIPFEVGYKKGYHFDFVIPNAENPKFFVEVKGIYTPTAITFERNASLFSITKQAHPDSKIILITNQKGMTPFAKRMIDDYIDEMFDFDDLQNFIKFVKKGIK